MRVLVITPLYPTGASPVFGAFVARQVDALRALGVEVRVVASRIAVPRRRLFTKYGELAWGTLRALRWPFDLVHVHFPTLAGVMGLVAARVRGRPLVVTLHGGELDDRQLKELAPWRRSLTGLSARRTVSCADAVVAVSESLATLAFEAGAAPNRVSVMDMGVDCERFRPRRKEEARAAVGLGSPGGVVLFVGWLLPLKGPERFIQAAKLLEADFPTSRWVLVGTGPMEAALRELAAQLGLAGRVIFAGERRWEEVASWDAAADVLVMPSVAEQLGLVALEASACGTPVVACDVGGVRSVVRPEVNGILVPAGDVAALAAAVGRLLRDPVLRGRLGEQGVALARGRDLREQARKVYDIYRRLAPAAPA